TDVYRLDGAPPALVLLARTPYDKEHIVVASNTFDILRAVQAGYVVVVQDVRGRFASEGEFNPQFQRPAAIEGEGIPPESLGSLSASYSSLYTFRGSAKGHEGMLLRVPSAPFAGQITLLARKAQEL
ncbi:MAG TPA: CocE/NonD family hydrolase, partial [Roseiflexaceae bacterium]